MRSKGKKLLLVCLLCLAFITIVTLLVEFMVN